MKRLTALILALAMICALGAATAEEGLAGEWYGLMYGAATTLTFSEDGTYILAAGEESTKGTYELKDGIVYMDGSTNPDENFAYDGLSLVNEQFNVTFTRENSVQGIILADVNPDAPREAFAGEWTCRYMSASGVTLDLQQVPDELLREMEPIPAMKIDGTDVTLTGMEELLGSDPVPMVYADGALTAEKAGAEIRIQILQDGMAAVSISLNGREAGLWFEPAAAAE